MRVANVLRPPAPDPAHETEVESLQKGYPIRIRARTISETGEPRANKTAHRETAYRLAQLRSADYPAAEPTETLLTYHVMQRAER